MRPLFRFDEALASKRQVEALVGVDEAGRGPLAGPVVAAAVALALPYPEDLEEVRDSKVLPATKREELFDKIRSSALRISLGWALPEEVDRENVLQATLRAMSRAAARLNLEQFSPFKFLVVVDGKFPIPGLRYSQEPLVNADAYSLCVASASIIAKVVRDRWMLHYHRKYPEYGFARHKGYATREHLSALNRLGVTPIHRRTFAPVAQMELPLVKVLQPA